MKLYAFIKLSRLENPIGIWLLLFPCWWGIALASQGVPDFWLLFIFALGAIVMRTAGCIYNDIIDKDFDKRVERTQSRPLASGELKTFEAIILLIALLGFGLWILLQLPLSTIILGIFSLLFVALYPWMKRLIHWPQAFLGVTFGWGVVMGASSVGSIFYLSILYLYLASVFWVIGYDTIYAYQDIKDDMLVGVKSSAIFSKSWSKLFILLAYSISLFFLWLVSQEFNTFWPYTIFLFLVAIHMLWQVLTLYVDQPINCHKRFVSNTVIGWLVFFGIVITKIIN